MIDVVIAALDLLEPGGTAEDRGGSLERIAASGAVIDLNAARPFNWQPNHVYGFTEMDMHELAGAGNPPQDREVFSVRVVYVQASGEEARAERSHAVSQALDDRAEGWMGIIRANRHGPKWLHVGGRVDYSYLTGIEVRGVAAVLDGYRYI